MNQRQRTILKKLKKLGHVSIADEAMSFGVNEMTIRRDLKFFEELGEATRVHGGAIPRSQAPLGVDSLISSPRDAQVRIAREVVKQLDPGSTVLLNTGTTVLQVAREIAAAELRLTVMTNSLPVAVALYQSDCQVLLTGGALRQESLDLTGPITEKNLDEVYVDVLIAGCDGAIPEEGFFTTDLNLAEMEKKSVKISRRVIVITESFKFGKRSFAKFASPDEVDLVISDDQLNDSDRKSLASQNVTLTMV